MLDCQIEGEDLVLRTVMKWGVGFALNGSSGMYGPNESAFGHGGWGGSFGFGDPQRGISVGYSMNYMREPLAGDMRAVNLIRAIYSAIGK
jgi:CubicO group peptidase (beta-lactamase class C family)